MAHLLEFYAVRVLVFILNLLPLPLSGWILERFGDVFFCLSPKRRKIAFANLTIAYGDTISDTQKSKMTRKCFQSEALSILELFLIKKIKKNASARFTLTGKEHFMKALARGKGIIAVGSHLGSWEYGAFPGYLNHFPRAVIVKMIKNKYLNKMIDTLRREIGSIPIPKLNAIRPTLAQLHHNHTVAVVIDQWGGSDGIWSDFFGKATSTTSLPARLAKKTGCALIPVYCLRKEIGHYDIQVLPEVPLTDGADWELDTTKRLNEVLESQIRLYPEQWSWGHRRWKLKPLTTRLA